MRPKFLLLKAGNLTVNVRFKSLADIRIAKRHVRFTPKSGHVQCTSRCLLWANSGHQAGSFDHLVGDGEHTRRNGEAERFGSREVDNELEFG